MTTSLFPNQNNFSCVIIGTGSIGQRHIQVLKNNDTVKVFALPMRPRRRSELQATGIETVESWAQVMQLGISHAIVATDTNRHLIDATAALDAGCQVLVEKPLEVDAVTALQACQLARHSNLNLWVGCCLRFQQGLNTFREQLLHIGKIHSVRIECQSYLPEWRPQRPYKDSYSARYAEGGVLRDLIHEIDYAGWLFGWPEAVTAKVRATQYLDMAAEDNADILWETNQGVVVSLTLDYLSRPARRQMRAYGEFGTLAWDGYAGKVSLSLAGEAPLEYLSDQTRDEMYLAQDLAFLDAGSRISELNDRLASGADGVRALAICDAARTASENKIEMKVSYPAEL